MREERMCRGTQFLTDNELRKIASRKETMKPTDKIELTILAAIAAHAILDMCKTTDEIILKLKMKNAVVEFLKLDVFIKGLK